MHTRGQTFVLTNEIITVFMKAILTTAYGSPSVFHLGDVAKPTPKTNEILVKIKAASVTKADTMMRTGKPHIGRLMLGLTKPKNPIWGTGFAGIIESVGSEVTRFKAGDKVAHGKWGTGTIVAVKGSGNDMELQIAFPAPVGVKRLLAGFAPITKVE